MVDIKARCEPYTDPRLHQSTSTNETGNPPLAPRAHYPFQLLSRDRSLREQHWGIRQAHGADPALPCGTLPILSAFTYIASNTFKLQHDAYE